MVDTVIVQSGAEATAEDPKHIAAMIAKVDAQGAAPETPEAPATASVKPEWVPEKFWDADKGEVRTEAMAQSYKELESKRGDKPADAEAPAPEADPSAATQDDATKELAAKGLNLDEFNTEFQQGGSLSEGSYQKLADAGYPRAYVDTYIAGQKAMATQFQAEVKTSAGGDDGFTAMVTWAATNADPKEVAAYNRAIDSGDIEQAKLAVAGMYGKFQNARPDEPSLISGSGGRVSGEVYEARAELIKDMASDDYKTNPAFRRKVQDKLGRSNIL